MRRNRKNDYKDEYPGFDKFNVFFQKISVFMISPQNDDSGLKLKILKSLGIQPIYTDEHTNIQYNIQHDPYSLNTQYSVWERTPVMILL